MPSNRGAAESLRQVEIKRRPPILAREGELKPDEGDWLSTCSSSKERPQPPMVQQDSGQDFATRLQGAIECSKRAASRVPSQRGTGHKR